MQKNVVISLFDDSGNLFDDWREDGYALVCVDILNPVEGRGSLAAGSVLYLHADLSRPWSPPKALQNRIAFVNAHPPCDHLAVSGARWFKGKGLRALAESIHMFATASEMAVQSGAPYMIENPVSTISTYWRKPDFKFQPYDYTGYLDNGTTDNYTKNTCLWVGGGFVMPPPVRARELPPPDNRVHTAAPGPMRAYTRSITPKSFGRAVYLYNCPTALT